MQDISKRLSIRAHDLTVPLARHIPSTSAFLLSSPSPIAVPSLSPALSRIGEKRSSAEYADQDRL
jgi:hypothetical protein